MAIDKARRCGAVLSQMQDQIHQADPEIRHLTEIGQTFSRLNILAKL